MNPITIVSVTYCYILTKPILCELSVLTSCLNVFKNDITLHIIIIFVRIYLISVHVLQPIYRRTWECLSLHQYNVNIITEIYDVKNTTIPCMACFSSVKPDLLLQAYYNMQNIKLNRMTWVQIKGKRIILWPKKCVPELTLI